MVDLGLRRIPRFARTLARAKPIQVYGRMLAPLRRRASAVSLPNRVPKAQAGDLSEDLPPVSHDPWNAGSEVAYGVFTFLHQTEHLGWPPDWTPASPPLLWEFNLHYHQFLHLLKNHHRKELLESWIEENPIGTDPGWHPYTLSRRIPQWMRFAPREDRFITSLFQQAAYLHRNIEWHVLGNHLLENARALILAGTAFRDEPTAEKWFRTGMQILRDQSREQILPDGGHFERSPMYQAHMVELYLDVIGALKAEDPARGWLSETARRMADHLASVVHPDGGLALFNDSSLEIAPPAFRLLECADRVIHYAATARSLLPDSGYYIWRSDRAYLMVDGGPLGPDYLLAHAHADIFSFELSLYGQRFIVDSGVSQYARGPMRDYVRSTRAHNTVSVDGVDQAECWASFRVARRYPPQYIQAASNPDSFRFSGEFHGYGKLIGDGIVHRRRIQGLADSGSVRVEDQVTGSGTHCVESRIHVHPEVILAFDGSTVRMERDGVSAAIHTIEGQVTLEESHYCPEFGLVLPNKTILLSHEGELPTHLAYEITF